MTKKEINKIIECAEQNPADDYWQFVTDNADNLRQIENEIEQTGRVKIDEI
jgi:hypothetical protein